MTEENHAIWNDVQAGPQAPALEADQQTDVVVIGAGITGVTAALLLRRHGQRVTLLERNRAGDGDTGGTSAHVTALLDVPYRELRKGRSQEELQLIARAARRAVELVGKLAAQSSIDARFTECPGFLYTEGSDGREPLREELSLLQQLGFESSWLERAPLPYPTAAAVRVERQAHFHPRAHVLGLLERARAEGVVVHEQSPVVSIDDGEPCTVTTEAGPRIQARHVVIAAHAPLTLVDLQTRLSHYASYVLAFSTASAPPEVDGLFCDDQSPYHYIRLARSQGQQVWVVGGADHRLGQRSDTHRSYDELLAWAAARFGVSTAKLEARWSSQVFESQDHLPFVGPLLGTPHLWTATGFGGNGLTWGSLGAEILVDGILQRSNPFAELLSPQRVPPATAIPTFLRDAGHVARCYLGDLTKLVETDGVEQLHPGEGRVVRHGLRLVAAYRDTKGEVHAVSARCTHLGAIVRFNTAEKTWDCPCHGSRFDLQGHPLTGPALDPLHPIELSSK